MIQNKTFHIEFKDFMDLEKKIDEIEEKYHALLVRCEVRENEAVGEFITGIGDPRVRIEVWNCNSRLFIGDVSENDLNLNDEQKRLLEEWKRYVIEDENGGAINWSGRYFTSHESLQVLKAILRGKIEKGWLTLNALKRSKKV